jgi:hypothetical protein
MLTVIYLTNRGPYPLTGPQAGLGQYDLLAESLARQTFTDYEVLVIDRNNPLPRPELERVARRCEGAVSGSKIGKNVSSDRIQDREIGVTVAVEVADLHLPKKTSARLTSTTLKQTSP